MSRNVFLQTSKQTNETETEGKTIYRWYLVNACADVANKPNRFNSSRAGFCDSTRSPYPSDASFSIQVPQWGIA